MWSSLDTTTTTNEGGFLDESRAESSTDDKAYRRGQNVIPVMIGQLNCPGDEISVWKMIARTVTFVGIVTKIDEATTKISYEIQDETGSITALKWLEADKNASDQVPIQINTYVRIYGLIRAQGDSRHVLILQISPLEHLNDLISHLLEVTYTDLLAEKIAKEEDAGLEKVGPPKDASTLPTTYYGMTEEQAIVYNIVHVENESETGISRSEIKARVPRRILPRTDDIIEFLVCEGHIYTTCTDDHFKTT